MNLCRHFIAFLVFIACWAPPLSAAPGDIDPGFRMSSTPCSFQKYLHRGDDGALYVVCSSDDRLVVAKFHADGTRDPGWGADGIARRIISGGCRECAARVLTDALGRLVVVLKDGRPLRLNADGSADLAYGAPAGGSGEGVADQVVAFDPTQGFHMVVPSTDGGLASLARRRTAGTFGRELELVARKLTPGGRLDIRFGRQGEAVYRTESVPIAFSLSSDGTAELMTAPGQIAIAVPGGAPQPVADRRVTRVGIANMTGPLVLADGSFLTLGSTLTKALPDGTPDPAFGVNGRATNLFTALCGGSGVLSSEGKSLVVGLLSEGGINLLCVGRAVFTPVDAQGSGAASVRVFGIGDRVFDPTGGLVNLAESGQLVRYQGIGPRADVRVVEYYNVNLDHYFMTAMPHEIAILDAGNAGPGWTRTGQSFGAWNIEARVAGTEPVCRFYGDLVAGPNSHFYSAQKFECDILAAQQAATPVGRAAWRFEQDGFRITVPEDGACLPNHWPVRRFYNNGITGPNHRYVVDDDIVAAMRARGWTDEGITMCAVAPQSQ